MIDIKINIDVTSMLNSVQARKILAEIFNNDPNLVSFTMHARDQMRKRDLKSGDVLNVLKAGKILSDPEYENGRRNYMNKCTICGSKMNKSPDSVFHYADCGLSKVYLKGVTIHKCTNKECGEEEVTIPNIEELHQLLAEKIATQFNKLNPSEIRFLRTHLGFSGVDFAASIGVSPETVSRWEKGTVNMKEASERFLRVLILTKVGPFRNYVDLKDFASKTSKTIPKYFFKVDHAHWSVDKAA